MPSSRESRAQTQDEFALRSQQRADAAYKEGRIQEELIAGSAAQFEGRGDGRVC